MAAGATLDSSEAFRRMEPAGARAERLLARVANDPVVDPMPMDWCRTLVGGGVKGNQEL